MRNLLYIDFTDPKTSDGYKKAFDGQNLLFKGDNKFRRFGNFWTQTETQGFEIAESTTNLIADPFFILSGDWSVSGASHVTFNVSMRNLFNKPAWRGTGVLDGTNYWARVYKDITVTTSTDYTLSCYVYISGDVDFTSDIDDVTVAMSGAVTAETAADNTIRNQWQRVVVSGTTSGTTLTINTYINGKSGITSYSGDIYFTGFQLEQLDHASPFVEGDRRDSYCNIPMAGNFPGYDSGTILVSIRPDWNSDDSVLGAAYPRVWYIYDGVHQWYLFYHLASDKFVINLDDGTDHFIATPVLDFNRGDKLLIIFTWDGSKVDLWVNKERSSTVDRTQYANPHPKYIQLNDNGDINSIYDEFAIFDEAFTLKNVEQVYANFSAGIPLSKLIYERPILASDQIRFTSDISKTVDARIKHEHTLEYLSDSRVVATYDTDMLSDSRVVSLHEIAKLSDARIRHVKDMIIYADTRIWATNEIDVFSNAVVIGTEEMGKLSDARILHTVDIDILSDAIIFKTEEIDNLSDSRIVVTHYQDKLSDTRVVATHYQDNLSDSRIVETVDIDKLSDTRIFATPEKDLISNTRVVATYDKYKLSDSRIIATEEIDKFSDAIIFKTEEIDNLSDSRIIATYYQDKLSDTRIVETIDIDRISDTRIVETIDIDRTSDTRIVGTEDIDKTSDSRIIGTESINKLSDSRIFALEEMGKFSDAIIFKTEEIDKLSDARIVELFEIDRTSDSRIFALEEIDKFSDAIIFKTEEIDKLSDARIVELFEIDRTSDSRIVATYETSRTADARVMATYSKDKLSDAVIISIYSIDKLSDSRIVEIVEIDKTADARILTLEEMGKFSDSRIVETLDIDKTADAYLSDPWYNMKTSAEADIDVDLEILDSGGSPIIVPRKIWKTSGGEDIYVI